MAELNIVLSPLGIPTPLDALPVLNGIDLLRSDEGSSLTFMCDNASVHGQPNAKVLCCGEWTGWEERRFGGDTVFEALRKAVRAYGEWMDGLEREEMADPINLAGSGPVPIAPREG